MNYTTNFNLNKPEGTDLYNHLTIDNPNMDTIDAAMQANKLASIGNATELVSGTVHAITRSDSNQNIFKFKATGDFKVGDTITVDGNSVNAFTTSGQQLLDDAYVLSAEVVAILSGASLFILTNKNPLATDIPYNSQFNVKDKIDSMITSGTLNPGSSKITIISGKWTQIGNLALVSAVISVSQNVDMNELILGNIPTALNDNVSAGTVTAPYTANDNDPKSVRVYQRGIHANNYNEIVAGNTYCVNAMYLCVV